MCRVVDCMHRTAHTRFTPVGGVGHGSRFTPREDEAIVTHSYEDFLAAGFDRTRGAWQKRKEILRKQGMRPSVTSPPAAFPPVQTDVDWNPPSWREFAATIEDDKKFRARSSTSRCFSTPAIETDQPIAVIALSDLHFGSWGTDYKQLVRITDELLSIPNLYVILLGDIVQLSVKLRSVAEVLDNAITPEAQYLFAESYLTEIAPRSSLPRGATTRRGKRRWSAHRAWARCTPSEASSTTAGSGTSICGLATRPTRSRRRIIFRGARFTHRCMVRSAT